MTPAVFRKIFFWAHLATGLSAGLLVASAAATGILLAFEPQIVEFSERSVRNVTPPANAAKLGVEEIVAAARSAAPGHGVSSVTLKSDPAASATVGFGKAGGTFYVDPYTGKVLGKGSKTHAFMHKIEDWHRWYGNRELGKPVTGAACLAFFFLSLSGLYIWWPRKWDRAAGSAFFFGRGLKGRARDWNWHNVIGFWFLPLIILTTLTGTVMSYRWANDLLYRMAGSEPPPAPAPRAAGKDRAGQAPAAAAPISAFFAKAGEKVPGWISVSLRLKEGAPAALSIEEPGAPWWALNPKSQLSLDASSAEIVKWEPYRQRSRGRTLRTWAKYLHTGEAFGPAGQALMAVSAAAALVLIWTGFALSWRRFFVKTR